MSRLPISGVKPSDILGGAMFAVGVAVLLGPGSITKSTPLGVLLMVLGIGAAFGSDTFVELVGKLLISNAKKDGDSESDDEIDSGGGDDGTGDGEVDIDRPPGEKVKAES